MTAEDVVVPGGRDVRGKLDRADAAARVDAAVVACPPHPQHGGSRSDPHLRAVGAALADRGLDCLRFDYGPWDGGRGEGADARNAVAWARERYRCVGLFGYSFGGGVAILAAGDGGTPLAVDALSVLAPHDIEGFDVASAVPRVGAPAQLLYGSDDDTADWEGIATAARGAGWVVSEIDGDHFFGGASDRIAGTVAGFVSSRVG